MSSKQWAPPREEKMDDWRGKTDDRGRSTEGRLDVDFVHKAGEGDALSDVFFAGEPGDGSFDAEAEAAVRH